MTLLPGDRVHYPGDPRDVGTLVRRGRPPRLVVRWDDGDLDECVTDGTLTTIAGHRGAALRLVVVGR